MRMWIGIHPSQLCRQHLLGEHNELHKHRHNFIKRHHMNGRRNQIMPQLMQQRHDDLAAEMLNRGYKHRSPYTAPNLSHLNLDEFHVDKHESRKLLIERCPACAKNIKL